jgi:hypothetical protein
MRIGLNYNCTYTKLFTWSVLKLNINYIFYSQSKLEYDDGPYTQGVGVFYTESFNTFKGLLKRYWRGLIPKKKEELVPAEK